MSAPSSASNPLTRTTLPRASAKAAFSLACIAWSQDGPSVGAGSSWRRMRRTVWRDRSSKRAISRSPLPCAARVRTACWSWLAVFIAIPLDLVSQCRQRCLHAGYGRPQKARQWADGRQPFAQAGDHRFDDPQIVRAFALRAAAQLGAVTLLLA